MFPYYSACFVSRLYAKHDNTLLCRRWPTSFLNSLRCIIGISKSIMGGYRVCRSWFSDSPGRSTSVGLGKQCEVFEGSVCIFVLRGAVDYVIGRILDSVDVALTLGREKSGARLGIQIQSPNYPRIHFLTYDHRLKYTGPMGHPVPLLDP